MEAQENAGPSAARHARRRRFWQHPSMEAFAADPAESRPEPVSRAVRSNKSPERHKAKRMVALTAVVLTCASIAALLLMLILWS